MTWRELVKQIQTNVPEDRMDEDALFREPCDEPDDLGIDALVELEDGNFVLA